jgi:hypothetical protein
MFEFIKKLQLLLEAKKPAGDYAALSIHHTSVTAIKKWALKHNVEVDEEYDLHITTAYSRVPFEYDWNTLGVDLENVEAVPIKFDVFETTNSKTRLLVVLALTRHSASTNTWIMGLNMTMMSIAHTSHCLRSGRVNYQMYLPSQKLSSLVNTTPS